MPPASSETFDDNADAKLTVSMDYFSPESEMGLFLRIKDTVSINGEKTCLKTHCVKIDVPGFSIIGTELKDFKIDRQGTTHEVPQFLGVRKVSFGERRQKPREKHGTSNFSVRRVQSVGGQPGFRTAILGKDEETCAENLQNTQDQRKTEN